MGTRPSRYVLSTPPSGMTTPNLEWDCYHCGQRCGGRSEGGYGAITGPDGALHASCSPDDPAKRPHCYPQVTEFGEPPGGPKGVTPLPPRLKQIRKGSIPPHPHRKTHP